MFFKTILCVNVNLKIDLLSQSHKKNHCKSTVEVFPTDYFFFQVEPLSKCAACFQNLLKHLTKIKWYYLYFFIVNFERYEYTNLAFSFEFLNKYMLAGFIFIKLQIAYAKLVHISKKINKQKWLFRLPLNHFPISTYPAHIYLLKVNNRNTRKRCEVCSKFLLLNSNK